MIACGELALECAPNALKGRMRSTIRDRTAPKKFSVPACRARTEGHETSDWWWDNPGAMWLHTSRIQLAQHFRPFSTTNARAELSCASIADPCDKGIALCRASRSPSLRVWQLGDTNA